MHPWASVLLPMTLLEGEEEMDGAEEGNDDGGGVLESEVAVHTTDPREKTLTAKKVAFFGNMVLFEK
jgi:hypothetical protein